MSCAICLALGFGRLAPQAVASVAGTSVCGDHISLLVDGSTLQEALAVAREDIGRGQP